MLDFYYLMNAIGAKDGLLYIDASIPPDTEYRPQTQIDSLIQNELEYAWILLRQGFSFVNPSVKHFPFPEKGNAIWEHYAVVRYRCEDMERQEELVAWQLLKEYLCRDYSKRKAHILRGKNSIENLMLIISERIEDFPYEDRSRFEISKLTALVLFVYDYCILNLREAVLDPYVDRYLVNNIRIGGSYWETSQRICRAIEQYLTDPYEVIHGTYPDGTPFQQICLKQSLCLDDEKPIARQNPKAADSYLQAMFIDLLHRFFTAFGIKKRGKWGKEEKILLSELLRFFGLSNAISDTSITTIAHDYCGYFSHCRLHSWLREKGQPYAYLMCCDKHPLFDSNDEYSSGLFPTKKQGVKYIDLEETLEKDFAGTSVKITNTSHPYVAFGSIMALKRAKSQCVLPDELSYISQFIKDNFIYIAFLWTDPQYLVVRKDLQDPAIWRTIADEVQTRLGLGDDLLRDNKNNKESILQAIHSFRENQKTADREKIDERKLYMLFLFIYDYVMLTYKESALRMQIKRYVPSSIAVNGQEFESTALIDDILMEYISRPYYFQEKNGITYRVFRDGKLYAPSQTPIITHPTNNIVNPTAMFCDLFIRFLSTLSLTKREGAIISKLEKNLIAKLAFLSGICNTSTGTTVASIYTKNKDYFIKSNLAISIRENEYWHLMLNTQEEELFGPPLPMNP